jgi:outer membrane receptor protein involved in Fe transport
MYARISAFLAAFAVAVAGLAAAQETTGTIAGRVVDAQGLAVPGATVTATGPQGARTTVTDAAGRFTLPLLTPSAYMVRVELQGFRALEQRNVNVSLGQTVDLDLIMQVGGLTETVEVAATAPVVDTRSTTVGATISSEMLGQIPIGRRFTDALYMAPGVSDSGRVGNANPSIGGGTGLENAYVVDGVNITNAGYGAVGSYSIVFGSLGTGLPYDFMKEIQVKTSGYEAEFGMSTGGVVNVITKSGTNLFSGTGFGYFQPDGTEAGWKDITLSNGAVNRTGRSTHDIGFQVGGPAVRDRLFWIGAINPVWEVQTFRAQGLPLASLGAVDRERTLLNYSLKGTYQVASNHRLEASFYGDPATGDMGPQRIPDSLRATNTASFSEIEYGGHQQVGKYDGVFGSRWLLEASIARAYNRISETPSVNEWRVIDRRVTPNVTTGGIGFFEVGNEGTNLQYSVKSTNIFGGHQLRYGFTYEDIAYDNIIQRTGPPITLANGTQTMTGAQVDILPDPVFGAVYRVVRANTSNVRETGQEYPSFFVQDSWQVTDRLTVRPGLRYDQQKLVGNLKTHQWDGNWAPRIGATYDPTGAGRAKIFGNWGRFYAKIPNDLAARALSADAGVTRADYFDAALTRPIPNGTLAGGQTQHLVFAGQFAADIDPDSKSTYLDETLVGVEYEVWRGVNAGIRYIHRTMPRILEDIGTAPQVAYFLGTLDSVEYFITNPSRNSPVTDVPPGYAGRITFEDPVHDYDAVELTLDRRFADNWSVMGSYRWSRLFGDFEGFFRNDNGQSDPAITSLYDFPVNDPSYTEIGVPRFGFKGDIRFLGERGHGPLPNDRPHQFKVFGNRMMGDLNLGMGLVLGSGRPLTAMAANPDYVSAGEIPEGPRGSGVRTVDGFKERTPFETDFDLHADYSLRMGERRVVVLADVFNLFNMRRVRNYQQNTQISFPTTHPDYGKVSDATGTNAAIQAPFRLRLGIRYEF